MSDNQDTVPAPQAATDSSAPNSPPIPRPRVAPTQPPDFGDRKLPQADGSDKRAGTAGSAPQQREGEAPAEPQAARPQAASDPKHAGIPAPAESPPPIRPPSLREKVELDADTERELEAAMAAIEQPSSSEPGAVPLGVAAAAPSAAHGVAASATARSRPALRGDKSPIQRYRGKVLAVHGDNVFVDFGQRDQGVLSLRQFPAGAPEVGSELQVVVQRYDEQEGLFVLSRPGAAADAKWGTFELDMVLEVRVTGTNKGGLVVETGGVRGFVPASQADLYRIDDLSTLVGQKMLCVVTEVDNERRNLVLSRRALLEREREEARERLWNDLQPGQVRDGVVRTIKDYGAFIDLGGMDGLLHVGDMSWTRVAHPRDLLSPGQKLQVKVLSIDREKRKIGLGLKQLQSSPWEAAADKYRAGSLVKGRVTRLMNFGAFVELEPGVEGLVHISALAGYRVRAVGDVLQPGQEVEAKVLGVDGVRRRIALSLKEASPVQEATELAEPEPPPRPRRDVPLRGGLGPASPGGRFGPAGR